MSLAIKTRARAPAQHDATSSCLPACARACGERARATIHTHSHAHAWQCRATHSQSRRARAHKHAMTRQSTYKAARAHLKEAFPQQPARIRSGDVSQDCCGGAKTNAVGTCSADAAAELPARASKNRAMELPSRGARGGKSCRRIQLRWCWRCGCCQRARAEEVQQLRLQTSRCTNQACPNSQADTTTCCPPLARLSFLIRLSR